MIAKVKKISAAIFVTLIAFCMLTPLTQTHNAQAQTFVQRIPTFGLYCEESDVIQSGSVNFDLTNADTVKQGTCKKQSEYHLSAVNREVEFAIPFIAAGKDIPPIVVKANGQEIEGSVWYGDSPFALDYSFDIDNVFSPNIDDTITGTHYRVVPDNETITIELSFTEGTRQSYIYDTSNSLSSSNSASGSHVWNLQNALSKSYYEFFIIGEASDHTFTSSCEYQTETMTCKEFIDSQYEHFKEFYDEIGIPLNLFYSLFNKVLKQNINIKFDELFFNSIDRNRVNAYKFSLPLDKDTVISYELPVSVQSNYAFNPTIYLAEQKHSGNYSVSYTVRLNDEMPYIIESSSKTDKNETTYTANTSEDFYFVFSSSEKPTNTLTPDNNIKGRTIMIVCIVVGGVALIGLATLIGITLYRRKS